MSYTIQKKLPSAEEWIQLRDSANWHCHSTEEFEVAAKNSLYGVSIYSANEIIGMGRVVGDDKICFYLQDIVVKADYQSKGIGNFIVRELMLYICQKASKNAVVGLMSAINVEPFYEKFLFVQRPNKQLGSGMIIPKFDPNEYYSYLSQFDNVVKT